ncbi:MAG: hypothetical protein ACRC8Z_10850 [Empedobacter falsenii]
MNDKNLLEYIQMLGLTNEEFAAYIDVSYDTLKTWLYRNKEVPKKKVDYVLNKIKIHPNYTILQKSDSVGSKMELSDSDYLPPSTNIKVPYYDVDFADYLKSKSSNDKLRNGMPKEAVKIINRHSSEEITEIYATEHEIIMMEQNIDKFGKFE